MIPPTASAVPRSLGFSLLMPEDAFFEKLVRLQSDERRGISGIDRYAASEPLVFARRALSRCLPKGLSHGVPRQEKWNRA
jgi:hypothetical protein